MSPFSVACALAMVRLGARGTTAEEMDRVLGVADAARFDDAVVAARRSVAGSPGDGVALALADAIWLQQGISLVAATERRLRHGYGAAVELVDFSSDPDAVVDLVNAWVRASTQGMIATLVDPGSLPADARLVLVDAIFLRAAWDDPFDPSATTDAPFTTASGHVVSVPTMRTTRHGRLAGGDGWVATSLDYRGGRLELVVVIPEHPDTDVDLGHALEVFDGAATVRSVALCLPRFRLTARLRLRDRLAALGMSTAFGPDADFSALTRDDRVMIDDVVHAATIVVDEAGTEAAAATGVSMRATGMPLDPVEVRADRPFHVAVRDRDSGALLFAGRVDDPSS
jgi:serpin B